MMERKRNLGLDLEATGKQISKAMERKGYKAQAIASLMGLTYQSVWKWCKGEAIPDVENLLILSRILDTTMDELVVSLDSLEHKIDDIVSEELDWVKAMEKKNIMRENMMRKNRVNDSVITPEDRSMIVMEHNTYPNKPDGKVVSYFKKIS